MSVQPGSFSFSHSHWLKFYPSCWKRWFLLPESRSHMESQILNRLGLTSSHLMWVPNSKTWGRPDLLSPIPLCQSSLIPCGTFHLLAMLAWETSKWSLLFCLSFQSPQSHPQSLSRSLAGTCLHSPTPLSGDTAKSCDGPSFPPSCGPFQIPSSIPSHSSVSSPNNRRKSTQDSSGYTRQRLRITS